MLQSRENHPPTHTTFTLRAGIHFGSNFPAALHEFEPDGVYVKLREASAYVVGPQNCSSSTVAERTRKFLFSGNERPCSERRLLLNVWHQRLLSINRCNI